MRDDVIERARQAVFGNIPSNNKAEEQSSPMAREVSMILNDERIINLEQIIKNSSSLPPLKASPIKRRQ